MFWGVEAKARDAAKRGVAGIVALVLIGVGTGL